jgi:PAS domain S-box-containing protein
MNLSRKIRATALLLAAAVLAALIGYWVNLAATHERQRQAALAHGGAHGRQLAESLSHHLSALFSGVDIALSHLADHRSVGDGPQFENVVRRVLDSYPDGALAQISVVDAEGYLTYSTIPDWKRIHLGDREHFQVHRRRTADDLFISTPVLGRTSGLWSIQFTRPVIRDGHFAGVIVVSVAAQYIAEALGELQLEPTDVLAVISGEGAYLARVPRNAEAMGKAIDPARPFLSAGAERVGTFEDTAHFDGVRRLFSWAKLERFPVTVVVGFDRATFLRSVEHAAAENLRRSALGTLLFSALTLAGIVLLFRLAGQQRRLVENERRMQQIVDASLDALITIDEQSRIVVFNVAAEKMFGSPAADVIGRSIDRFIPAAFREAHRGRVAEFGDGEARSRPMGIAARVTGIRRDGSEFPIEVSLSPVVIDGQQLFTASIRDLSATENARSALRDANLLTREIIACVREGIIVYGTDQRYRVWNPYMEQFTGMAATEVLGRHPREVFPFLDEGGVMTRIEKALAGDEPDPVEFAFEVRQTGVRGWASDLTAPLRDSQGRVIGAIGTVRDITAVKDAESKLRELNQTLERRVAERTAELLIERDRADAANRAKSAFLANMSHEIRTPMTAILGMSELLRLEPLSPRQTERLDRMHDAAQHLLGILSDILDLSKIEAGKLTLGTAEIDLRALAQGAIDVVEERARERGLQLSLECVDQPVHVIGDPTRLRQALLNYLSNAVKFSERGRVVLRLLLEGEDATSVTVRFEVEDNGIGIAPEDLAGIFEHFQQIDSSTTRQVGGTGLGLAIVRQIVTLMGGRVGVSSLPGEGSTFWFCVSLPRADAVNRAPIAPMPSDALVEQAVRTAPSVVLVADDERANREVISGMLEALDVRILVAENGKEAAELAAREHFDLILMDLHMPEIDGFVATRQIRQAGLNAETPIIALTGDTVTNVREQCREAGMNDFISKPFRMETLLAATRRWLNH